MNNMGSGDPVFSFQCVPQLKVYTNNALTWMRV